MSGPQQLARSLAARAASLPDPVEAAPDPDQPPAVIRAALDALDAGKTKYTDRPGILPLRTWVAETLSARCGLSLSPDAVTITCGGTEARFVAVKKLAPAGTHLFCAGDPAPVAGAAALVGATLTAQPDDPAAISALYLAAQTPASTRDPLLDLARTHGWWVIWDTSGADIPAFHPATDAELAPRVVTIGSLSGAMPGWRMGWLAGSEQAAALRAYKQSMTICSPSISQWAALGLVESQ